MVHIGARCIVACCMLHARAQTHGGVISIRKGTALFDSVLISDSEARVRAGRGGDASRADARGGGVGGRGVRPTCGRAQLGNGGVVSMDDGAVTFKGGTISNTRAVRVRRSRSRPSSRVTNARALRCIAAHDAACPRGGHATQCR
jgi:hypothetical protein